jgi:hypothetical protein
MRWGNGTAPDNKMGMKARVAEAMANGDTIDTWPGTGRERVTPATSQQLAAQLGVPASYVRSTMRRIRNDLGPQAV